MKGHILYVVISLSVVFIALGLLIGQIPWVGLAASIIGFSIAELTRHRKINGGETDSNDNRTANHLNQFAGIVLLISFSLLFLFLVSAKYGFNVETMNINYLMIYVIVTFFTLITGGAIIRRRVGN
ncbi:hypothetical protein SAMN05216353_13925 [Halobacillus alkaliphilus]|uniref:DUF2178 domain-containing protein n=1 Tax=Halobacillus alkaliphilus TaxID=396056 RepID=A0A1I2RDP4_9BACI|nr:hypothetical protein [Halobacillus alkaliphilus]SFG38835.1 hypothetical protein SAMN05216353_13925 [Halobacillus alkaliphilus]